MPRCFVAVTLATPEALAGAAGPLPAVLHLTLRFFGGIEGPFLTAAEAGLRSAAAGSAPFELELRGVGAFPSGRAPRVVWAGVGAGGPAVVALAQSLDAAWAALGIPRDPRGFTPHVTLFRVRTPTDRVRADALLGAHPSTGWGAQPVREITLYESELRRSGAVHRPRAVAPLGVAAA